MPYYKGKNGKWITTETGRHVFIPEGEDPKDVMKDLFDEEIAEDPSEEPEFDDNKYQPWEYLYHFKEHKDKTTEDSMKSINPGYIKSKEAPYGTPEYYARTHNCFKCTIAAYIRLVLGLNVQAKPAYKDDKGKKIGWDKLYWEHAVKGKYRTWTEACFKDISSKDYISGEDMRYYGYKGCKGQKRYITQLCKEGGPGTFYSISIAWAGTRNTSGKYSFHSVYAYNDNGTVKFFDSQDNSKADEYWDDNRIKPIQTEIIKLNGREIDNDWISGIIEEGEYEYI